MPGNVPWPSGPYAPEVLVGDPTAGTGFGDWGGDQSNWKLVQRIDFWFLTLPFSPSLFEGMQTYFSDGTSSDLHGQNGGAVSTLKLQPGEKVTKASLFSRGMSVTGIKITTPKQEFEAGVVAAPAGYSETPVPVGSGLFIGVAGSVLTSGSLASLAFLLIKSIKSLVIKPDKFIPDPSGQASGISPYALDQGIFNNQIDSDVTWRLTNSTKKTSTQTFTQSTETALGATASVEALVFEIVKVRGEFSWKQTSTATYATTTSNEITFIWDTSGTASAGKTVSAAALCREGKLDLEYTGTAVVTVDDNTTFSFTVKGTFQNVLYALDEVVVRFIDDTK